MSLPDYAKFLEVIATKGMYKGKRIIGMAAIMTSMQAVTPTDENFPLFTSGFFGYFANEGARVDRTWCGKGLGRQPYWPLVPRHRRVQLSVAWRLWHVVARQHLLWLLHGCGSGRIWVC